MYYLESALSREDYISALKQTFHSPFQLWDERVCGTVLGSFFSIAYHSPHEWNRKITDEVNRAWGFVKQADGKTQVYFIRGKGNLSPFWFVIYALFCYLMLLVNLDHDPVLVWVSLGISLFMCIVTAFQSSITEAGAAGFHEVTRLLQHPEDYYG